MTEEPEVLNSAMFQKLVRARMPFGKYAQRRIIDLPETYLIWFRRKGLPKGELGRLLEAAYEIKLNGLTHLIPAP